MENVSPHSDTTITSFPTPYATVNVVLHDFAVRIQALLGNHFQGMYLYGSLALGDFDPATSDIDFLVVTDTDLPDDLVKGLQDLHEHFATSHSPWVGRIEAAYIPLEALHHTTPTSASYPQFEKEIPFFKGPLEIGWSFQRHTLYEHGVRVAGPEPRLLFEPVDPLDMQRAAAAIAQSWQERVDDPDWLSWIRQRGSQAFVVLTLSRLLYALEMATVVSKPAAARWGQKALPPQYSPLIERALIGQHESGDAMESEIEETIDLIRYTVERIEHPHDPLLLTESQGTTTSPESCRDMG